MQPILGDSNVNDEDIGVSMDNKEFWEIIDNAKISAESIYDRPQALRVILSELEPTEIQSFYETYKSNIYAAYTWPLWGAAYIINGGCSDDCFDYFRDWLISEGQDVFKKAVSNPESLADLPLIEEAELEEFRYVADEVYEEKTGQDMMPKSVPYPGEPIGAEWEEDEVYKLFPRIAGKYQ